MKKHRKLFPIPTQTLTNSTDCSYYSCSDPFADYYLFPNPPPEYSSSGKGGVSPPIIVLFAILSLIIIILLYYIAIAKSCFGLFRRNRTSDSVSGHETVVPETEAESDHPVWLIVTAGLQQSVINSIAVAKYRRSEGLIDGTGCLVCLSEFREGETLRILPKCSHAFHVACIDTWLRSHTNCPLCRAGIVAAPASSDRSETVEIGGGSIGSGERIVVAESENDVVRVLRLRRSVSMGYRDRANDGQRRERGERFSSGVKKRSLSCGSGMRFLSSRN